MEDREYLAAAASDVARQLEEMPGLGIPVDPDVAEFMGAFEEDALSLDDMVDDAMFNGEGDMVIYDY